MSLQGITDDSRARVDVYFYDANNRVLDQVSFLPDVQPNVEYNVLYTKYVDKDVIENAVRIAFFSHSGNAATTSTSSSSGNSNSSTSTSTSTSGSKDINDLVNYISNYGTKTSVGREIAKADSNGAETRIVYQNNGELVFYFTYKYSSTKGYVNFVYDIATESVETIYVIATGQWTPPVISGNADFDISSYTSTTSLDFYDKYNSLSADDENLLNILVRAAIPSFGMLMVDTAGITLADIGFDSY